jgi:hypothetical protein
LVTMLPTTVIGVSNMVIPSIHLLRRARCMPGSSVTPPLTAEAPTPLPDRAADTRSLWMN